MKNLLPALFVFSVFAANAQNCFNASSYNAGLQPVAVCSADFDGDGDNDIAVANQLSNNVGILMGSPGGTFATQVTYGCGGLLPAAITANDLDGDGDADLAVVNNTSGNVAVLMNLGNGTFSTAVTYNTGSGPADIISVDLNGDGKMDIATANYVSGTVSFLQGSGTGTFATAVNYGVGTSPTGLDFFDFNSDGYKDLIVANSGSGNLSFLRGTAAGTFVAAVSYSSPVSPRGIRAVDVNNDGIKDVVVTHYTSNDFTVMFAYNLSFYYNVTYPTGSNPVSVTSGDLNNDGWNDIIVASSGSNELSVSMNNKYGYYSYLPISYGTSSAPMGVACAHFNGDGKPDLVSANYGGANTTVFLNSTPSITVTASSPSVCAGSTVTLTASGVSTYTWLESSFSIPYGNGTTATVAPRYQRDHYVVGTAVSGCTNSAFATVVVYEYPEIAAKALDPVICSGSTTTLVASGATSYTWSSGQLVPSFTVSPATSVVYTVTGNNMSCLSSVTVPLVVNPSPTISAVSANTAICLGGATSISATSAGNFIEWYAAAAGGVPTNTTPGGGSIPVTPVSTTTYYASARTPSQAVTQEFNYSGVIESFTVPAGVNSITVDARGASGGDVDLMCIANGGRGARIQGVLTVTPGEVISILVGQAGSSCGTEAGGGGGSFIARGTTPLIVAGGGGGASNNLYSCGSNVNGIHASITTSATASANGLVAGGTNGLGGAFTVGSGGSGGGFFGDGGSGVGAGPGGRAFVNGGAGGNSGITRGGFGGGSSWQYGGNGGGGGGYSGGGTDGNGPWSGGGGGGSFNSGSSPVNTMGFQSGNGKIVFSYTMTPGCASEPRSAVVVSVNPVPAITVNSGAICSGQSFTMVPSGAATYTISGGSATVSPLTNTSYSVQGTSAAGCISTVAAVSNVTVNATPVISVNSGSICSGQTFTMVPSGAASYVFSNGSATVTPAPGITTYTVNGTSAAGCASTTHAVSSVTVNLTPAITVNSGSICTGQSFTMLPANAVTYTFSSGSAVVTPFSNTSYTVNGTSAAGCVNTVAAVSDVTVFTTPAITVNSGTICSGQSFTMVPGGAVSYTYSSGTAVVSPVANQSYSVSGTSAAGCISTVSAVSSVTVHAIPAISVNSGSICAGQQFIIVPSGAAVYSVSGGTTTVSPSTNTTYVITGTSSAGCASTLSAISSVTVHAVPVISVNSGSICAGGSFVIVPSGAATYSYSGGSATVFPAGTTSYSVGGTSAAGCVSTSSAVSTVTVNAVPLITVNSGSMCTGGSYTLVPGGAFSYTIVPGGSTLVAPGSSTAYSVTGTSTAGCAGSNTAISNVTVHTTPVITVNSGSVCNGQPFVIVPGGASTYTVQGGSLNVSPNTNTTYTVAGTSVAGCVSTLVATSSVTVHAIPAIVVNSGSVCSGGNFTIVPSGASTYTYSSGGPILAPQSNTTVLVGGVSAAGCASTLSAVSTISVFQTPAIAVNSGSVCGGQSAVITPSGAASYTITGGTFTVTPAGQTSYTITGTSAAGCVSTVNAVSTISVQSVPVIAVNSGSVCTGETFTIIPSGALTYTISGGSFTVTPGTTTSYTIDGTDAAGCTSSVSAVSTVTVNAYPTLTVNSGAICAGEVFTLVPGGAATYTMSSGQATVSPAFNTNYTVTGTSAEGCTSTLAAVSSVTVNPDPVIGASSGSICAGGTYSIVPSGAAVYTITGGSFNVSPSVNSSYTITGTSSLGCTGSSYAVSDVTVHALPDVLATAGSNTLCAGDSTRLNGTGAASYTWSGGIANGSFVHPLSNVSYTLSGTDQKGCSNISVVSLTVHALPQLSVSGSNATSCEAENVTLTVNGAASYTWSNGRTGNVIIVSPTVTTQYSVTGTDLNGCRSFASFSQSVIICPGVFSAVAVYTDVTCSNKNDGIIRIDTVVNYPQRRLKYAWHPQTLCPGNNCSTLENVKAGVYSVTVSVTYTTNSTFVKTDSIVLTNIQIRDERGPCSFTVYSGITINNDGVNDKWMIENISQFPKNKVNIFNRWGEQIANIEGYDNEQRAWPTKAEEDKLGSGTYFYVIDPGDGSAAVKGWVELIKN